MFMPVTVDPANALVRYAMTHTQERQFEQLAEPTDRTASAQGPPAPAGCQRTGPAGARRRASGCRRTHAPCVLSHRRFHLVGRLLGAQLVLGVDTAPLHALVQGAGTALRIGARAFRIELEHSAALRRGLERYIYVLMSQLASAAACVRFHLIEQRLARWLLMSQDRSYSDSFHVTHEFLAYMLGVRRVSVTAAAGRLQRDGVIDYHRGELTVLDRKGLEAAACSCYAKEQRTYAEMLA